MSTALLHVDGIIGLAPQRHFAVRCMACVYGGVGCRWMAPLDLHRRDTLRLGAWRVSTVVVDIDGWHYVTFIARQGGTVIRSVKHDCFKTNVMQEPFTLRKLSMDVIGSA